jgi:cellulose synthase/poly-beta-1,6-N-acetylglucosamine synthase-like glycosyltransferase
MPNASIVPFVSVILPIRNERVFIARTLDCILRQNYPSERYEVVVADGMSDDGTREIVADYARRDARVRLVDNLDRVTPTGLNAAIRASRGTILCRIDGHCEVADDFISHGGPRKGSGDRDVAPFGRGGGTAPVPRFRGVRRHGAVPGVQTLGVRPHRSVR